MLLLQMTFRFELIISFDRLRRWSTKAWKNLFWAHFSNYTTVVLSHDSQPT